MVDYTSKWNNYVIGKTPWINHNRDHCARAEFCTYINSLVDVYRSLGHTLKVIEIGAGECTEAKILKDSVDYTVADVSDTFLDYAKSLGLKTIQSDIIEIDKKVTEKYDICYCCNVLEHAPDVYKAIKNIKKIASRFFVTMFRWCYNGNMYHNLYSKKDKIYYTSTFDVEKIFYLFGNVEFKMVSIKNGWVVPYEIYEHTINKEDPEHRNGNWLSFCGEAK